MEIAKGTLSTVTTKLGVLLTEGEEYTSGGVLSMEIAKGTLSSVITKLGVLLTEEYKLQRGVKGEIRFLQSDLESMKGALEKVSNTPPDQLDIQDKIWIRDLRELSYDIEDYIDTFMVRVKGDKSAKLHSFKNFLLITAKIRHGFATDIRGIKSRIAEVQERRVRGKRACRNWPLK